MKKFVIMFALVVNFLFWLLLLCIPQFSSIQWDGLSQAFIILMFCLTAVSLGLMAVTSEYY